MKTKKLKLKLKKRIMSHSQKKIEKRDEIRDLGAVFGSKLTFTPHIDAIVAKTIELFGAGYRFTKEIRSS